MGKITKTTHANTVVERPTKADYQLAIKVADRIELETVRLMSCKCEQKRLVAQGKKHFLIEKSTNSVLENETNRILVLAKFKLETYEEGADDLKPFAVIEASFLLMYLLEDSEGLTQDHIDRFGNMNGIYNAWPYWREFTQNAIARMSLSPLTIPVFRLLSPKKEKNTGQKTEAKNNKSKKESAESLRDS